MSGAFGSAALELHAKGLKVIPAGADKAPLVSGWNRWRGQSRSTVERLAKRYAAANVAVLTGGLSGTTVIDCDDENTLADAEHRFGRSPLVTRSPRGGGHIWMRSSGEGCANLRRYGLNIDIKGAGGYVIAPPSKRAGVGDCRIIRGSWDDLRNLPPVPKGAIPTPRRPGPQAAVRVEEGNRNNALFVALKHRAHGVESLSSLIAEAHGINALFSPPLHTTEVEKTAGSVWRLKKQGNLLLPGEQLIPMFPTEWEALSADSFYLLSHLKRCHGAKGADELIALSPKAMARDDVLKGWGVKRYRGAISALLAGGYVQQIHKGGRKQGDPNLYRMGARKTPNITYTPPLASPSLSSWSGEFEQDRQLRV